MAFTYQKPSKIQFTSPSIHLHRVGYYKTVAEQSEAQGDGIYTSLSIQPNHQGIQFTKKLLGFIVQGKTVNFKWLGIPDQGK